MNTKAKFSPTFTLKSYPIKHIQKSERELMLTRPDLAAYKQPTYSEASLNVDIADSLLVPKAERHVQKRRSFITNVTVAKNTEMVAPRPR